MSDADSLDAVHKFAGANIVDFDCLIIFGDDEEAIVFQVGCKVVKMVLNADHARCGQILGELIRRSVPYEVGMKTSGTLTFGLFVIVVLAAIFWLMHGRGQTQWGLVAVLVGILLLRVILFVINLRQQRHNAERGKGPVNIETRLGLNDEPETTNPEPPAPRP